MMWGAGLHSREDDAYMSRLNTLKRAQLKERLEALSLDFDLTGALSRDPIRFARAVDDPRDQELVAILSASLAYGRVSAISVAIEQVLSALGPHPVSRLLSADLEEISTLFEGFVYRFTRAEDLRQLCLGLAALYQTYGSVGEALRAWDQPERPELYELLCRLYQEVDVASRARVSQEAKRPQLAQRCLGGRGYQHLWSDPKKGSALKRVNMLTRWMVRGPDEVDLGLWRHLGAHRLTIPLDAHVFRTAQALGLTRRASPSWRAAREVTEALKLLDPRDPVRYDFALAHLGISGSCAGYKVPERCGRCALQPLCSLPARAPAPKGRPRRS